MSNLLFLLLLITPNAYSDDVSTITKYQDIRCCVDVIERDKNGRIKRDPKVKREHRRLYPCPTNPDLYGPCPGWQQNHDRPLACGGRDIVSNLSWVPVQIKTCKEDWCIDRYEREINCKAY